jgi:peptide/nickel transport system permease protein
VSGAGLPAFVARRLVALVVLLLILSFGVFSLLYAAPGKTELLLLGPKPQTPAAVQAVRQEYHLDKPFLTQYGIWLKNAVQLDFGRSIRTDQPVVSTIRSRAHIDLFLGFYAFAIAMGLGVPLGILAAVKRRGVVDRVVVGLAVMGVSAPPFASGLVLLYVFAVALGWFPAFGAGSGFFGQLWHLALPALALALTTMALVLKFTRAAMVSALDQDYVAFARARGLSSRRVLIGYALRNALVPIITAGGLILGYTLSGALLVEVTFALPGVGSFLITAVEGKDFPIVQGIALTVAITVVLVNLLTDVLYLFVDPRIRFRSSA